MALDYLPSPSWAVIYGETPSADRWSELGENDDALATGAGWDDNAVIPRHIAADAVEADNINGATFPAFSASRATTQAVASATFTKCLLTTEEWDILGNYDPTQARFTAPVGGLYIFTGRIGMDGVTREFCTLYVNGTELHRGSDTPTDSQGTTVTAVLKLVAGDYVELWGWRSGAGNFEASRCETYFTGALIAQI